MLFLVESIKNIFSVLIFFYFPLAFIFASKIAKNTIFCAEILKNRLSKTSKKKANFFWKISISKGFYRKNCWSKIWQTYTFLKGFCLYLWTGNFWDDLDPHGALYSTLDLAIFDVFEGQFLMILARKIVFLAILRANMNARGKFFLPVDRASKTTPKVHRSTTYRKMCGLLAVESRFKITIFILCDDHVIIKDNQIIKCN